MEMVFKKDLTEIKVHFHEKPKPVSSKVSEKKQEKGGKR